MVAVYIKADLKPLIKHTMTAIIALIQAITFFCKFWSNNLMAKICYTKINSIEKATHVKVDVIYEKFTINNRVEICEIKRIKDLILIEFEKIFLIYKKETGKFERQKLKITQN